MVIKVAHGLFRPFLCCAHQACQTPVLWQDRWEAAAGVAVDARAGGEDGWRWVGTCIEMEATCPPCLALSNWTILIGPMTHCVALTVWDTLGGQREGTIKNALPNLA